MSRDRREVSETAAGPLLFPTDVQGFTWPLQAPDDSGDPPTKPIGFSNRTGGKEKVDLRMRIKVFDPAVLEAMRRMQATLEELRRGQQKASSILSFDGKTVETKPRRGGRAAECGGLLNLPALFVLTTFHIF